MHRYKSEKFGGAIREIVINDGWARSSSFLKALTLKLVLGRNSELRERANGIYWRTKGPPTNPCFSLSWTTRFVNKFRIWPAVDYWHFLIDLCVLDHWRIFSSLSDSHHQGAEDSFKMLVILFRWKWPIPVCKAFPIIGLIASWDTSPKATVDDPIGNGTDFFHCSQFS